MPRITLLALTLTAAAASAQSTQPAPSLPTLAAYSGTWVMDGKWANGNMFKARQSFQIALDGKAVICQTWSASGTAAETPRDLAVYNEENGDVYQTVFSPAGASRHTKATPTSDGTLQFDWKQPDGKGGTNELRQVFTPIDAGRYGWRVMMHIKGEWHTLIAGEWKRG